MTQRIDKESLRLSKSLRRDFSKEDLEDLMEGVKKRKEKEWEKQNYFTQEQKIVELFLDENELSLGNIAKKLDINDQFVFKTLDDLGLI